MSDRPARPAEKRSEIILYQTEDGQGRIQVRLEGGTVWLPQSGMVDLYQTTKQNVSLHIQNIYEEGELAREATVKQYLTVQTEGSRKITRPMRFPSSTASSSCISTTPRIRHAAGGRYICKTGALGSMPF